MVAITILINNADSPRRLRDHKPSSKFPKKNKISTKIPRPTCSHLAPAHPSLVPETRSLHLLPTPHLPSTKVRTLPFPSLKSPFILLPTWPPISMDPIFTSIPLFLILISQIPFTNPCNELCGGLFLPYPFHLNSSCGPQIDAFRLTCSHNSSLFLTLGLTDLRIIAFLTSSSILVDYSSKSKHNSSPCARWYADLNDSAGVLNLSAVFAVTRDNVLRLYDCDDSSVCRSGCERVGGCVGVREGCCYPLSDGSVWKAGEGFGVFGEYGCRGFSSWVEKRGLGGNARRGIEVEWAVPMRLVEDVGCADGAVMVNATVVKKGFRCACGPGLVGDGFAHGIGCFKGDFLFFFLK